MALTVFLSGGQRDDGKDTFENWRRDAEKTLQRKVGSTRVHVLSPHRRYHKGWMGLQHVRKRMARGNFDDIKRSDVVLVEMRGAHWGTAIEMGYAYSLGIPIVLCSHGYEPNPHLMVEEVATAEFPNLENAITYITDEFSDLWS